MGGRRIEVVPFSYVCRCSAANKWRLLRQPSWSNHWSVKPLKMFSLNRVTRLGEFSPLERLIILEFFLKNNKINWHFLATFFPRHKLCANFWQNTGWATFQVGYFSQTHLVTLSLTPNLAFTCIRLSITSIVLWGARATYTILVIHSVPLQARNNTEHQSDLLIHSIDLEMFANKKMLLS
jgi:hypothetical protein